MALDLALFNKLCRSQQRQKPARGAFEMLKNVMQGFEFTGFGLHVVARWWDVELRFCGYGAGAMWGQAGDNLYLYGRRTERHWCWRDACRWLTGRRERVSAT